MSNLGQDEDDSHPSASFGWLVGWHGLAFMDLEKEKQCSKDDKGGLQKGVMI